MAAIQGGGGFRVSGFRITSPEREFKVRKNSMSVSPQKQVQVTNSTSHLTRPEMQGGMLESQGQEGRGHGDSSLGNTRKMSLCTAAMWQQMLREPEANGRRRIPSWGGRGAGAGVGGIGSRSGNRRGSRGA